MQLDACLRSIQRFAPYRGPITVVYTASTAEFAEGYEAMEASAIVSMQYEDDFEAALPNALDDHEYTVFHTDDDVFFRSPPAMPAPREAVAAVSLRLGRNTTYCYSHARGQPLPPFFADGPFLAWDWTRARDDFAYPMSVNGHIFQTVLLRRLLARSRFMNPNQLEEELHLRRYRVPRWLLGPAHSCVVSIPVNAVGSVRTNRVGSNPDFSPTTLNRRFLNGEQIALDSIEGSSIRGAHQELALAFEPRGADG
jgi:hypothetical protein